MNEKHRESDSGKKPNAENHKSVIDEDRENIKNHVFYGVSMDALNAFAQKITVFGLTATSFYLVPIILAFYWRGKGISGNALKDRVRIVMIVVTIFVVIYTYKTFIK